MEITNINQNYLRPKFQVDSIHLTHNRIQNDKKNKMELTDSEKKQIEKLKTRDREVRIHENQHKMAAGQYARGVTYTYQTGPDNQRYAIGGEALLDTSTIPNEPEKTIGKMKQIKRSALAPAEPSSKDRQIAAMAEREIVRQQKIIQKEKNENLIESYSQSSNINKISTIDIFY